MAINAVQLGSLAGFALTAGSLAVAAFAMRMPFNGLIVEPEGIKVRNWLTHRCGGTRSIASS